MCSKRVVSRSATTLVIPAPEQRNSSHPASFGFLAVFIGEKFMIKMKTETIPVLGKSKAAEKKQEPAASACCAPKNNAAACCTPSEKPGDNEGACCAQPADGSACCDK